MLPRSRRFTGNLENTPWPEDGVAWRPGGVKVEFSQPCRNASPPFVAVMKADTLKAAKLNSGEK
jgi:hypothetical protein